MPRASVFTLLVFCLVYIGCGSTENGSSDAVDGDPAGASEDSIVAPDVIGSDGAGAVSLIEAEGLTITLADAGDDWRFDPSRDPAGCEVTDQEPAAGELVAADDDVTVTIDCRQVDWENYEGSAWEAFDDAYGSAFEDGCAGLFDSSPDGALYEDDYEYTLIDCQNLAPADASDASDVPSDVPDDPEAAGADLGELDGCRALFDEQGVLSLNYGTESFMAEDCPIGG